MNTQALECLRCNGSGMLNAFTHIAKGRCFLCGGTGEMSDKIAHKSGEVSASFQVFVHSNGDFHYAKHSVCHTDKAGIISTLSSEMIHSADEARKEWKAKKNKNVTLAIIKANESWSGAPSVTVFQEGAIAQVN